MCGIAGMVNLKGTPVEIEALEKMAAALRHRGPDDQGVWIKGPVGLTHTRLAIIDLSPLGHQPMLSASEKSVVVFNGEIYNFPRLKRELKRQGVVFRSQSDTEVLIEGYEFWGMAKLVKFLKGMFAFAIWDEEKQALHLARDRFGKKPLYYMATAAGFRFSSELKAILAVLPARPGLNPAAVEQYFTWGYVPEQESIFAGIGKIPPGCYATFNTGRDLGVTRYWDLLALSWENAGQITWEQALARLEGLLQDAVQKRLISDVPLGAFLSGGVDSSLVVALMKETSGNTVKTYHWVEN